jgi:hypothetical protein
MITVRRGMIVQRGMSVQNVRLGEQGLKFVVMIIPINAIKTFVINVPINAHHVYAGCALSVLEVV